MRLLILLFLSLSAFSQPLTIGVKGGLRVTSDIEGIGASESQPYLVGPMIEARWRRFAFEFDALYSRVGYSSTFGSFYGTSTQRVRANSWEFPLLAKYRVALHGLRLYPLVGYAPRHVSGTYIDTGYSVDFNTGLRSPFRFSGSTGYDTGHALVAGGGLDFAAGHIHITPEVRYLRWKDPLFTNYGSQGYYLSVPQNEVQILLGIGWGGR